MLFASILILGCGSLCAFSSCGLFNSSAVVTRTAEHEDPPPSPYIIGKDDVLNITVWREPQLSGKTLVASDGTITVPLIGTVPAAGMTCEALQNKLHARLTKYTLEPNVTVRLLEPRSHVFYALGQVRKPGMFQLRADEVLSQGLAQAGGFTDFADPGEIKIFRHTPTSDVQITVDYNRVASGKNMNADIPLQPGDTIMVP
ncbi:MAG: polysaccharide biosynthesis/export family protein [Candidatus Binataceae bacterium]